MFLFGNSIVFASCSRLRFLDVRFGIFVFDRNFKFLDRILIFLEIKSRVWVLIKNYSCLVVSCFLFHFLFLLCIWIFVSNLVRPRCKKKKKRVYPKPSTKKRDSQQAQFKKKNLSQNKKEISFVVFFIIRVYFVLSILFLHLVCVSYLWLCQINSNLNRVLILSFLGVCVRQFYRVCFLFSLKVFWYQI